MRLQGTHRVGGTGTGGAGLALVAALLGGCSAPPSPTASDDPLLYEEARGASRPHLADPGQLPQMPERGRLAFPEADRPADECNPLVSPAPVGSGFVLWQRDGDVVGGGFPVRLTLDTPVTMDGHVYRYGSADTYSSPCSAWSGCFAGWLRVTIDRVEAMFHYSGTVEVNNGVPIYQASIVYQTGQPMAASYRVECRHGHYRLSLMQPPPTRRDPSPPADLELVQMEFPIAH